MTTDDIEAVRDQRLVSRDRGAWTTTRNWREFEMWHTQEEQDAAWAQLAAEANARTDGIAHFEGVIDLPVERAPAPPPRVWTPRPNQPGQDLDSIPTEHYVHTLTGEEVRQGKRCDCPLPDHDDHSRDFAVTRESDTGWCCYGCNRGGTIFQFAAYLWGYPVPLRGDAFREVRERLQGVFR